jgi:hypothetical protein
MKRVYRCLVCTDAYQIYKAPGNALDPFKFLEELVLDGHSDIDFGEPVISSGNTVLAAESDGLGMQPQPTPTQEDLNHNGVNAQLEPTPSRMSYRRMKVKFPSTLRTLRVYNSHVPDIYFIRKVIRECPELRSLTLARCTIFTRANCEFWNRLPPSESDSYFSNQEVGAYAVRVTQRVRICAC